MQAPTAQIQAGSAGGPEDGAVSGCCFREWPWQKSRPPVFLPATDSHSSLSCRSGRGAAGLATCGAATVSLAPVDRTRTGLLKGNFASTVRNPLLTVVFLGGPHRL
jgi:hypothetical protein